MQKWCPEPLLIDGPGDGAFLPLDQAAASVATASVAGFRPEAGFANTEGLLAALSRDERAEIVKLIEIDLRQEYEQRHADAERAREEELARCAAEFAAARDRWYAEFADRLRDEVETALAGLAHHTVAVAVLMAEKLVRAAVEADPEVLVRALETVLYKVEAGCSLQVTLHPEDAAWLGQQPQICQRLRITDIKEDRRLDRGGALVKADDQEWDATVTRQLAVLAETLEDALAIPPEIERGPEDADA